MAESREHPLSCVQEVVLRTERQHCQALPMLLSNQLKEDFEGGGGMERRERGMGGEEKGRDCGLLSLVMVRPSSMCGCLFTDTRRGRRVGGDGLKSSHDCGLVCCLHVPPREGSGGKKRQGVLV